MLFILSGKAFHTVSVFYIIYVLFTLSLVMRDFEK